MAERGDTWEEETVSLMGCGTIQEKKGELESGAATEGTGTWSRVGEGDHDSVYSGCDSLLWVIEVHHTGSWASMIVYKLLENLELDF